MTIASTTVPAELQQKLRKHRQEHVLAWWGRLRDHERRELIAQLWTIDLERLAQLYADREHTYQVPDSSRIKPLDIVPADAPDNSAMRAVGEEALRRGEVAVLVVAGGQGSRLGFDHPKGMYSIGPISGKSLFQIHAEKVLALSRRYGKRLPFLVMTSPATDAETRQFFDMQAYFGLPKEEVFFFCQGTMPALDLAAGKLLLEAPGRLFLSPDGHGGTLTALGKSGLLERLHRRGIRHLFYFQVDNPLVKIADPIFIGRHLWQRSEASSKIVPKQGPKDRLGNLALVDGRCAMIEYSDLPDSLANERDANGRLRLWAGSPAIHVFDVDFLARVTEGAGLLPFHTARKKVPYLDEKGEVMQPQKENALKFERFIFDVLPLSDRWLVMETSHREEFAPLKNAEGADSPRSVQGALTNLAADWLAGAGVEVTRTENGEPAVALEVSSLFALDADEFARRVDRKMRIKEATYFE
ncbi:MAG TPA: UDPGP type 1 family protein [Gemmataceae bacterium]|jgi:UDP-N-acetylglucosamine/UDP-N-acetylgalactosamine diphosphorylase